MAVFASPLPDGRTIRIQVPHPRLRRYSLGEVNAGHAGSHHMRDWCQCRDAPANVHGLSIGCSVGSARDSVLGIARVRHVFSKDVYCRVGSVGGQMREGIVTALDPFNDSDPTC